MPEYETCKHCGGTGRVQKIVEITCGQCGGSGKVVKGTQ